MSFGFSVGDFIAVTNLAWKLYQDCYKVLQDCPKEIKDLSRDLATVYAVLRHIQEDLDSNDSSIKAHGERRLKLLQTMVMNLDTTLRVLQQLVSGFQHLAVDGRKRSQFVSKLKWLVGQRKFSRIQQDLAFHISTFNLIQASIGNSSLQRIECSLQQMRLSSVQIEETGLKIPSEESPPTSREQLPAVISPIVVIDRSESKPGEAAQENYLAGLQPALNAQSPLNTQTPSAEDVVGRISALSLSEQEEIFKLILLNCQAACFEFYSVHALWRTKFESKDKSSARRLFDRDDGQSAAQHTDFTLPEWISKIYHAWSRRSPSGDSCPPQAIIRPAEFHNCVCKVERIPSMISPWGEMDIELCELAVNVSIEFCDHLKCWDSQARLKRLLAQIRQLDEEICFVQLYPPLKPAISPLWGALDSSTRVGSRSKRLSPEQEQTRGGDLKKLRS